MRIHSKSLRCLVAGVLFGLAAAGASLAAQPGVVEYIFHVVDKDSAELIMFRDGRSLVRVAASRAAGAPALTDLLDGWPNPKAPGVVLETKNCGPLRFQVAEGSLTCPVDCPALLQKRGALPNCELRSPSVTAKWWLLTPR